MGGRIYDPLAGRFLTPDPIMQAPYWSQGQNRYSYVFNDPINSTDPSGFMSDGVNDTLAGAGTFLHSAPVSTSIYALARGAGVTAGAIGASLAGGALNIGVSLATNPFGGSTGGSYQVPSGSAAATSSGGGANAPIAGVQNRLPGPAVQERADQLQESIESFDEAQDDERLASRGARRPPRGAPVPGGGGPVLRPQPPQPRVPVLLPVQRIVEILKPGGRLIGEPGSSPRIRLIRHPNPLDGASSMFWNLTQNGSVGEVLNNPSYPGLQVRLPGGGIVGIRPVSSSGPPTIDVQVRDLGIREIKFLPLF